MMLAPNEVLYTNFICRNIHIMHRVEFLLITSGSRCFPAPTGKRRMKLMICQISLWILP